MPAGPSYSLIYPPYPRPTKAEIRRYLQDLRHHVKATSPFKPVKPLPVVPEYPRPLLDKLNTYSTGCADVAGRYRGQFPKRREGAVHHGAMAADRAIGL